MLTFWILDDQSKHILARSVVRPFKDNLRVKWDPDLVGGERNTAKIADDKMPTNYERIETTDVDTMNESKSQDNPIGISEASMLKPEYEMVTKKSVTGLLVLLINTPITWYS